MAALVARCLEFHLPPNNVMSNACLLIVLLPPPQCHCLCEPFQDCFSMANVSWYGGASVRGQTWPINDQNTTMQPFIVSDLKDNPSGYGSVLERYFLGSSGKSSYLERMIFLPVLLYTDTS